MKKKLIRKTKKFLKYASRNHKRYWIPALAVVLLVSYLNMNAKDELYRPDMEAYSPLLNTIAKGESKGNYNAYFGNAGNNETKFTQMSVGEVMKWQREYVANGSPSSAVGKYQIIRPTLTKLVEDLEISPEEEFSENLQDRMAVALLEKRGSVDYANDKMSREEFAASIAKEWAALPRVEGNNPHDSFYAEDGLNKARLTVDEVFEAIGMIKS